MGKGKEKDRIWEEWEEVDGKKVKCRHCQRKVIEKHATRCKEHTGKCPVAPKNIKTQFREEMDGLRKTQVLKKKADLHTRREKQKEDDLPSDSESISDISFLSGEVAVASTSVAVRSPSSAQANSLKQTSLNSKIHSISTTKLKQLQTLWAKAIISGNASFQFTENFHVQDFFAKLGSGFQLPSRKEISSTILKHLDSESQDNINVSIRRHKHLSIIPDGWTNVRRSAVINIMLANTQTCIFYKSFETGSLVDGEDGPYIVEQLEKEIAAVEAIHGEGKIVAVVSDRGSNFLFARNQIANTSAVLSISCAPHMINRLADDFAKIPSVSRLITRCKEVVKDITMSKGKLAHFREEFKKWLDEEKAKGNNPGSATGLSIPSITRWFGVRDMFHNLRKAKAVLLRLSIREDVDLRPATKTAIRDEIFWEKLKNVEPIFKAITDGIAALEANSACLSDVVEEYNKLQEIFHIAGDQEAVLLAGVNKSEIKKCREIFKKRESLSFVTNSHYLANLLDPRYRGASFADNEEKLLAVLEELDDYASRLGIIKSEDMRHELGCQVTSFRMKEGPFASAMICHKVPHVYWSNMLQFKSASLIAEVAVRILSIPASSAGVERSFSVQQYVHTKSRNRLTKENVNRLMRIKWCLSEESGKQKKTTENDTINPEDFLEMQMEVDEDTEIDIDELIKLDLPFTEDELADKEI